MSIFDIFRPNFQRKKNATSASIARERLQIIVSHRSVQDDPDFMHKLRKELIEVIGKYVKIDPELIKVQLGKSENCATLELNVTLPNQTELESAHIKSQAKTTTPTTSSKVAPSNKIENANINSDTVDPQSNQDKEKNPSTAQAEKVVNEQKPKVAQKNQLEEESKTEKTTEEVV